MIFVWKADAPFTSQNEVSMPYEKYIEYWMIRQVSRSFCIAFPKRRTKSVIAMSRCVTAGPTFFLDPFALRQWEDPNYKGTRIEYDPVSFTKLPKFHDC